MSNITNLNRDYLIKINVKEATIDVPKMTFWNTDKKTSNMFVQLVINMSTNELISQYVTVQNATDYKITLNVIKPKTKQYKTIEATLLNEEKALFEIDLPDEFTDQVGDYSFEFEVSSKVDSNDESITTSNGTYKVNGSILTNLNEETSSSPDLPILKQLIEQVKSLQGGDLTGYQKKSDNSLETTSKEVVGAINEVNSQFKDIANLFSTEQTETLFKIKYNGKVIATIPIGNNQVTSYTVTNNLTYCNNNNSNTDVIEGNSYIANISPNTGYKLSSIIVSMGGKDITSTAYSNGVINIKSVTGNIIITATANIIVTPSTEPVLIYNFNNQIAGNGHGTINLSVPSTEHEGNYAIKYADDTGVLSNFADICTLSPTVNNSASYTHFNKDQLIPKYATKLVAIKNNEVKAEFTIPVAKRFISGNYGQHLYSFGAISDVHIDTNTAESDFNTALAYLNANENVAFTCISGDLTNGGTEAQFIKYKKIVDEKSPNTPVYGTNGNHEFYNASFVNIWNTYVQNPRDYIFTHENEVFIFLGQNTSGSAQNVFTEQQKSWLATNLEKYKNCRVFLFEHYFINGTGNGNYNSLYPVNALSYNQTYGLWLLNLLKKYTNVFLVTGHSHLKFITQELDSRVTICNNVDGTETGYMLHIPSITIPRDIINNGSAISDYLYAQSEGVVIDVYENCILYRGRNFVDEKFIPIGQFILQKVKGNLPSASTYTVTNTLSHCTNSNSSISITEGTSYQSTIIPINGYILSNVTVTMGGIDVTSTVVSGNNINIPNVTGNIVINASATTKQVPCTAISLNNNTLSFTNKTPQTLVATPTPSNTTDVIIWSVSPNGICTVNNGVVTPITNGDCTITVTCGNVNTTCSVNVTGLPNVVDITWQSDVKIDKNTGTESSNASYFASDYIPFNSEHTYTISTTETPHGTDGNIQICYYTKDKTFIKCNEEKAIYLHDGLRVLSSTIPVVENATYIRLRGYGTEAKIHKAEISITYS